MHCYKLVVDLYYLFGCQASSVIVCTHDFHSNILLWFPILRILLSSHIKASNTSISVYKILFV